MSKTLIKLCYTFYIIIAASLTIPSKGYLIDFRKNKNHPYWCLCYIIEKHILRKSCYLNVFFPNLIPFFNTLKKEYA